MPKVFSFSTIKMFNFYLEGGLENHWKRTETRGKSLCRTSFQLRMRLKKVQKQGRDERTQEDYPTSAMYFLLMTWVVFLRSLISALFLYFSGQYLTETKFYSNCFLSNNSSSFEQNQVGSSFKHHYSSCNWYPPGRFHPRSFLQLNLLVSRN